MIETIPVVKQLIERLRFNMPSVKKKGTLVVRAYEILLIWTSRHGTWKLLVNSSADSVSSVGSNVASVEFRIPDTFDPETQSFEEEARELERLKQEQPRRERGTQDTFEPETQSHEEEARELEKLRREDKDKKMVIYRKHGVPDSDEDEAESQKPQHLQDLDELFRREAARRTYGVVVGARTRVLPPLATVAADAGESEEASVTSAMTPEPRI